MVVTVTDPFGAQSLIRDSRGPLRQHSADGGHRHPDDGDTFYSSQTIDFSAYVFDPEEVYPFPENLIVWTSNIDGDIGNGSTVHAKLMTPGDHIVTVIATDGQGVSTQQSIGVHIQSGAGLPVVDIDAPEDGSNPPEPVTLMGHASDPEDGVLSGNSLAWYSDIDGFLGNGESVTVTLSRPPGPCTGANHLITLRATDSDGHSMDDHIHVMNTCIP